MPKLSVSSRMEMRATPALLSLAHLLTLSSLGLSQAVRQELAANPALEEVDGPARCPQCSGPVMGGSCSHCDGATVGASPPPGAAGAADLALYVAAPPSLADALLADLQASLPEDDRAIAQRLVGSLDEHGFLVEDAATIAAALRVGRRRVEGVLTLLRELGPPGIATRDTRECLLSQLDALTEGGVTCPHARAIVAGYLDDLGAHRHYQIARQLRITGAEVEQARDFIRRHCWPYPVQAATPAPFEAERRHYLFPDLIIREAEGAFAVEIPHVPARWLRPNPVYQDLARRAASLSEGEREHVQTHLERARTFLRTLRQREQTLRRIGEAIIARQGAFLRHGVRQLAPLTRLQIAADLGLHESTVSRAVQDKTAQLPSGVLWPLSDFFVAARSVHDLLRELVEAETSPLTDQELAQLLTERGHPVARRTVAKYREQLKILPHQMRGSAISARSSQVEPV